MRYLFLIPLLFVLTACSETEEAMFACPQAGFIKGYDVIDLKNKEISVAIDNVKGECEPLDEDAKLTKQKMVMDVSIKFAATSKAKDHKDEVVAVSYAVSLISPDETLLSKKIFSTTLSFDETGQAVSEEEHSLELPLDSLQKAYKYRLAIGFIKQGEVKNGK